KPIITPGSGFPDKQEFDALLECYVHAKSKKKKRIITSEQASDIRKVLLDLRSTAIGSSQHWIKKTFTLELNSKALLYHQGRPVAICENLFEILS
ncbi:hypothetical protein EMCG_05068, partial [[Emmonsia] crescens]